MDLIIAKKNARNEIAQTFGTPTDFLRRQTTIFQADIEVIFTNFLYCILGTSTNCDNCTYNAQWWNVKTKTDFDVHVYVES